MIVHVKDHDEQSWRHFIEAFGKALGRAATSLTWILVISTSTASEAAALFPHKSSIVAAEVQQD
jgi:hypothetical protein